MDSVRLDEMFKENRRLLRLLNAANIMHMPGWYRIGVEGHNMGGPYPTKEAAEAAYLAADPEKELGEDIDEWTEHDLLDNAKGWGEVINGMVGQ